MAKFYDNTGALQEVANLPTYIKAAAEEGVSVRALVNRMLPTNADIYGETFHQLCASEGIYFKGSKSHGLKPSMFADVLEGGRRMEAGVIVKDVNPGSRWLFMPALLEAVEDKLLANLEMNKAAFDRLVAYQQTIANDKFEQPVLNFSRPEAARSQGISQLALPTSMLTITTSDRVQRIPTRSLGIEWSEQATKATSLDLIALAIARQRAVELNENAINYVNQLLLGDADLAYGGTALSSISGKVVKASSFDSGITVAGTLTQKAWMKWLYKNGKKRMIDWVITDIDGALAIENRTGRPIITSDNPKSTRIDTTMTVSNPAWANDVQVFLVDENSGWPVNTIMGIDSSAAIARVISSWASYQAQEDFALKRGSAMRMDYGEIVYRLFDDAYEVLQLIP